MTSRAESEADRLRFCRLAFELSQAEGLSMREATRRVRVADGLAKLDLRRRAIAAVNAPVPERAAEAAEPASLHWWQKGAMA